MFCLRSVFIHRILSLDDFIDLIHLNKLLNSSFSESKWEKEGKLLQYLIFGKLFWCYRVTSHMVVLFVLPNVTNMATMTTSSGFCAVIWNHWLKL